jgi:hypothetical protein
VAIYEDGDKYFPVAENILGGGARSGEITYFENIC